MECEQCKFVKWFFHLCVQFPKVEDNLQWMRGLVLVVLVVLGGKSLTGISSNSTDRKVHLKARSDAPYCKIHRTKNHSEMQTFMFSKLS